MSAPSSTPSVPANAGFTLLEVLIAALVLSVGACAMSAVLLRGIALGVVNAETQEAQDCARTAIEQISDVAASEVYERYNSDPNDDPLGPGTAPGSKFTMKTSTGATVTVQVEFPTSTGSGVYEDVNDPELGMPRDLNGDGKIDDVDHSTNYRLIPYRVIVTWKGASGTRSIEMCAVAL